MSESSQQSHFKVVVKGAPTSVEDWKRVLGASPSELQLTDEQKAWARQFVGWTEEDYARSRLLHEYAEKRVEKRGIELGSVLESMLADPDLGPGYRLVALIYERHNLRWVVRVQKQQAAPVNVAVPSDLADDVLDSNTIQDLDRLRELLLSSLQRSERIR